METDATETETPAMKEISRRHDETAVIPDEMLTELTQSSDPPTAWQRFQSDFDFRGCDTRGFYFQYCSMVDELVEEAAEHRPRVEALIQSSRNQTDRVHSRGTADPVISVQETPAVRQTHVEATSTNPMTS